MFISLKSFHIHVVFPFDPIFPYNNLAMEIKGVIFLIAASSIQVFNDNVSLILLQS